MIKVSEVTHLVTLKELHDLAERRLKDTVACDPVTAGGVPWEWLERRLSHARSRIYAAVEIPDDWTGQPLPPPQTPLMYQVVDTNDGRTMVMAPIGPVRPDAILAIGKVIVQNHGCSWGEVQNKELLEAIKAANTDPEYDLQVEGDTASFVKRK